jgi:Big-like domain-containing protein
MENDSAHRLRSAHLRAQSCDAGTGRLGYWHNLPGRLPLTPSNLGSPVKTRLSAAGAAVAAAALAASALLATPGTAQAANTATITVNVVDQYGQPAAVAILALDQARQFYFDGPSSTSPVSSTHVFQNLPADGYSIASNGPWSGLECFGINPCTTPPFSSSALTPVVAVAEGGVASYTVHVTMPTVTGGSAVGAPLAIQTSPGYKALQTAYAQAGMSTEHTQQWLRGAADIPTATGPSYVTTPADAGQQVSARLHPSPAVAAVFATQAGYAVPDLVTNSITVDKTAPVKLKAKTKTKTKIAKRIDVGERATLTVKVKAKGATADPDGLVTVRIGKFKARKTLKKGVVLINVPNLEAGTYTIITKYLGSEGFEESKAKKRTLIVG